jgi:hypothetical protein
VPRAAFPHRRRRRRRRRRSNNLGASTYKIQDLSNVFADAFFALMNYRTSRAFPTPLR